MAKAELTKDLTKSPPVFQSKNCHVGTHLIDGDGKIFVCTPGGTESFWVDVATGLRHRQSAGRILEPGEEVTLTI